jgi:hypothetical protein
MTVCSRYLVAAAVGVMSCHLLLAQGMPKTAERYLAVMYPQFADSSVATLATESWHPVRTWYVWLNDVPRDVPFPIDVLLVESSTPCDLGPTEYFPNGACLPRFMPQDGRSPQPSFQAVFQTPAWDKRGRYSFFGSMVASRDKNRSFKASLREHPGWTDQERTAQLRAAGGKFGPDEKDAMLHSETLKRLRRLLGPYRVTGAKFLWQAEYISLQSSSERQVSDAVYWRIDAVLLRTPHQRYTFIIEPMEGEATEVLPKWPSPERKSRHRRAEPAKQPPWAGTLR